MPLRVRDDTQKVKSRAISLELPGSLCTIQNPSETDIIISVGIIRSGLN